MQKRSFTNVDATDKSKSMSFCVEIGLYVYHGMNNNNSNIYWL